MLKDATFRLPAKTGAYCSFGFCSVKCYRQIKVYTTSPAYTRLAQLVRSLTSNREVSGLVDGCT